MPTITHEEIAALLRPIISETVTKAVQASSGTLPPEPVTLAELVAEATIQSTNKLTNTYPHLTKTHLNQEIHILPDEHTAVGDYTNPHLFQFPSKGHLEAGNPTIHLQRSVTPWEPAEEPTLNTEAIIIRGEN